jgi:hypothetical protein
MELRIDASGRVILAAWILRSLMKRVVPLRLGVAMISESFSLPFLSLALIIAQT